MNYITRKPKFFYRYGIVLLFVVPSLIQPLQAQDSTDVHVKDSISIASQINNDEVQDIAKLAAQVADTLENRSNQIISFGVTAGPRFSFTSGKNTNAFIDVTDSTLQTNDFDRASFVLSASVIASPFQKVKSKFFKPMFFMLNIDIAEFGSSSFNFNNSVDGGIGLGWFLGPTHSFGLGFTLDKVSKRVLNDSMKKWKNQQIPAEGGGVVTSISRDDDRFFHTDSDGAFSFWFVYRFGSVSKQ